MGDKMTMEVKVRSTRIRCKDHPEWGIFGVMADHGEWWDIYCPRGWRVLSKSEFAKYWEIVA
jgi:hypothetical protein